MEIEPKMLKMLKKKRETIEPAKPIVYYIDPSTPDKWKKYIKAGIDDWQVALKQLVGKMLFEENTGLKMIQQ
jgi:hypothetical protein